MKLILSRERFIFRDASASIGSKDRIGLIGSNGAGKTTLLRVLANEEEIDDGVLDKANYVTIGYLPQDGIVADGKCLYEEAASAFEDPDIPANSMLTTTLICPRPPGRCPTSA